MKAVLVILFFLIVAAAWANFFLALAPATSVARAALIGLTLTSAIVLTGMFFRETARPPKIDAHVHITRDDDPGDAWKKGGE